MSSPGDLHSSSLQHPLICIARKDVHESEVLLENCEALHFAACRVFTPGFEKSIERKSSARLRALTLLKICADHGMPAGLFAKDVGGMGMGQGGRNVLLSGLSGPMARCFSSSLVVMERVSSSTCTNPRSSSSLLLLIIMHAAYLT